MTAPVLHEEYGVQVNVYDTEGDVVDERIVFVGSREQCEVFLDVTALGRQPVLVKHEVTPWERVP